MYYWLTKVKHPRRLAGFLLAAQAALAVFDFVTVPGIVVWQFNVIVILAGFFVGWERFPFLLAFLATTVVVLDFVLPPYEPETLSVTLMRRAFGIINFWTVAFATQLLIRYKNYKESLLRNLRQEKAKVERSNTELEHFASVAAHDLRSPLRSMIGWSQLLEETQATLSPNSKQAIHFIESNAKKCSELIDDLLELARVNAQVKTDRVALDSVAQSVVATLKPEIEAVHATITVEQLPVVEGNSSHLASVFSNLIRNALVYRDSSRKPEIRIGSKETRTAHEVFVRDNGIGIEAVHTGTIFEMFKRLHSESDRPGTGIGLALCKKIVELMGGRIWVESTLGKGSTFFIALPKTA